MAEQLDFTKPHLLRNEQECEAAIREIDRLLDADPPPGCEDYERLKFLSVLVEEYEERHFDFASLATPQDVVDFMLEQKGLSRADLAEWLGGAQRASQFFDQGRNLSLEQIGLLRERLGIPADLLISAQPSALSA